MDPGLGAGRQPDWILDRISGKKIVNLIRINPGQKLQPIVWRVECITENMTEMLRNNPPDVVYAAFQDAFSRRDSHVTARQRDAEHCADGRGDARQTTWYFLNRALRDIREIRELLMKMDTDNAY